jgi:hypothetical protein
VNDLDQYHASYLRWERLLTQFEPPYSWSSTYGNHLKAWFVPPATTRYRFYLSCDDHCQFDIGESPETAEKVIETIGTIPHREYFTRVERDKTGARSDWIELE